MMHGPGQMVFISGPAPGGGAASGPRWQWRRGLSASAFYNYGRSYDNTDGAFAIPFSSLDNEWGPSAFDRRHSVSGSIQSQALRNLSMRFGFNGSSASPLKYWIVVSSRRIVTDLRSRFA